MSEGSSHRQILRSSSIIGGASVINIMVGLVRIKVAAVLLGPSGVGLIGLLQSLMATASSISSLGFGTVGTRQVAEAAGREDADGVAAARRALFWGTTLLAIAGAALFWASRHVLAAHLLNDPSQASALGWLSIGVALTVASGSQAALLRGLRRVGDIARITVYAAILSVALGVPALLFLGERGVLAFVVSVPLATFVLGHWYVAKLERLKGGATPRRVLITQWKTLARLGAAFMVAGVVVTAGHLLVRTLIQRQLGADALGNFQASWTIAMTYIGFVLGAMGTDYYPRLTVAMQGDHAAANRVANEQTEVALLLAGPALLAMLGLAPWIIQLLYSDEFRDAAAILRWQVLGDILKIASWPLAFIMLAAGSGRIYMLVESFAIGAFVLLTWIGLPLLGIEATGLAFLGMYMLYLPLVYALAWRRTGFTWRRSVLAQLVLLSVLAGTIFTVSAWSELYGAVVALAVATTLGVQALARLEHLAPIGGPMGRLAAKSRRLMRAIGVWRYEGK